MQHCCSKLARFCPGGGGRGKWEGGGRLDEEGEGSDVVDVASGAGILFGTSTSRRAGARVNRDGGGARRGLLGEGEGEVSSSLDLDTC